MPRPYFSSPDFNRIQKVKVDSVSVLQPGDQEPIYTSKTKKATSQDIGFFVFCVYFSINTLKY